MRVGWVGRGEGVLSGLLPDPDASGGDLLATAMMIASAERAEEPR